MARFEIDTDHFLSAEEQKEIVTTVFRDYCLEKIQKDHERIFSNSAYNAVFRMVDDAFDNKVAEMIGEKVKQLIPEISHSMIFRDKTYFGDARSPAFDLLHKCVADNKGLLSSRIVQVIEELDKDALRAEMKECAMDLLDEKLFGAMRNGE